MGELQRFPGERKLASSQGFRRKKMLKSQKLFQRNYKTVQLVGYTADLSSCDMDHVAKRNLDLDIGDSGDLIEDSTLMFNETIKRSLAIPKKTLPYFGG